MTGFLKCVRARPEAHVEESKAQLLEAGCAATDGGVVDAVCSGEDHLGVPSYNAKNAIDLL